jgi:excisionase family DNA binding protein
VDEILTPSQVAELLKIHVKTVYKLAREGVIAGNRIGRSWRFSKNHILDLLFTQQGRLPAGREQKGVDRQRPL